MKNKKTIYNIVSLLILTIIIISGCDQSKEANVVKEINKPIEVAFISSMTGDAGIWGHQVKKGFDFALDEINSNGGISGRIIKVIYEDDECNPNKGISAYNKVIELDNVKIITGTVCSSVAMASMNKVKENNILYLASGASSPEVTKQDDKVFRLWVADNYEAKALAEYASKTLNLDSFGILACNDNPACTALETSFSETIKKNGKEITGVNYYVTRDKDVKTELTKLISDNPKGIYLITQSPQAALFINQLRGFGYDGKIFTYSPAITAEGVIDQIKDKKNIYYVSAVSKQETDFWERYKAKTGEDADLLVALGYDSMKMIEAGLRECGENNNCIRDYFFANEFPLSRGTIKFDSNGDLTGVKFEAHKV